MKHAPNKAIIGALITGVCTFILCIPFFVLLTKGEMPLSAIAADMGPGNFITPFICSLIQIPLKKKSTLKGKEIIIPDVADQASYLFMPKNNKVAFCAVNALVTAVVFTCGAVGLCAIINPAMVFSKWGYIIFKSAVAGVGVTYAIYHVGIMLPYITRQKAIEDGTWKFD